jgi:hypothetical protein
VAAWYYALGVKEDASPINRSVRLQITACGMVSCCSGGLAVRRVAAWYYVLGVKEDASGTCCNLQSYAPDDG